MNVLDICAGIGGAALGLHRAGMRHVGFCERSKFCQRVLAKHWPDVPVWPEIGTLLQDMREGGFNEQIDVVWASPPCQPASSVGKRKGTHDSRWLWPQVLGIVQALRPRWMLFENVHGLITLEQGLVFARILSDLECAGYHSQSLVLPACAVGAPHQRDRVFVVSLDNADREHKRFFQLAKGGSEKGGQGISVTRHASVLYKTLADADGEQKSRHQPGANAHFQGWDTVPDIHGSWRRIPRDVGSQRSVRRSVDGFSTKLDGSSVIWPTCPKPSDKGRCARLTALGNAVVPQLAEQIGIAVMRADAAAHQRNQEKSHELL